MCSRQIIGLVGCAEVGPLRVGPGVGGLAGPAEVARFYPVGASHSGFKQRNNVASNIPLAVVC